MLSDTEVQQYVYRETVRSGRPPRSQAVAEAFSVEQSEVFDAFRRLNARRLLALAPESGEITMAPPFSAAPTLFAVTAGGRSYFANCVWDAFGIPAALHQDASIESSCACCGDPMDLQIRAGLPERREAVAHFAVPAAHWWDDIAYT